MTLMMKITHNKNKWQWREWENNAGNSLAATLRQILEDSVVKGAGE
jgi:hypothetical protein